MVSEKFRELVKEFESYALDTVNLRAVVVAQWIHESGRGTSDLFFKLNNASGLKYRPELKNVAEPEMYTAHDGPDLYCKFDSLLKFIMGYWLFINRPVYDGWKAFANDPRGYIMFLKSRGYATDPEYVSKVMNHLPEAEQLLREVSGQVVTDYSAVTWLARYWGPANVPVLVAFAGATPVVKYCSKNIEEQHEFEKLFTNARTSLMASPAAMIPDCPNWKIEQPVNQTLVGKVIKIDPGHSELRSGSSGTAPEYPSEYELNVHGANQLKNFLVDAGATVTIIDPADDDLTSIGNTAQGCDLFLSYHHNALNRKDHYACVMIHATKAKIGSKKFAALCAAHLAAELPHKLCNVSSEVPRGVYPAKLSVLSAAENTNCPVCVLVEPYFVDAYGERRFCAERTTKASIAIGNAIVEYFQ